MTLARGGKKYGYVMALVRCITYGKKARTDWNKQNQSLSHFRRVDSAHANKQASRAHIFIGTDEVGWKIVGKYEFGMAQVGCITYGRRAPTYWSKKNFDPTRFRRMHSGHTDKQTNKQTDAPFLYI